MTWHVIARRHQCLRRGDSVIIICSPRLARRSRKYGIWLLRGRGYLWERVARPRANQDLQQWFAELGLDRDGYGG